jgi:alcohol dehydrogenase YqhD (iron-dependent ADH family)
MDNFKYYNPTKIIFGKDTISQIGSNILNYGFKKVLFLYGGGSIKQNGVYDSVIKSLKTNSIEYVEFSGVQPNPVVNHAREAINVAKYHKVDAILAVGGGSVIDEAKSIAAGFYVDDVWNIFEKTETVAKALPIFTILTLSATGSEFNSFAVLSNPELKKKWSFGSPYSYPVLSLIDPTVQMSLPWRQTINGGVDSLSHLMELYFAGDESETTLAINEALMKTIIKSMNELVHNDKNYQARSELAWCAALALNGLSGVAMNGGEWTVHRIEHAVSVLYPNVAHAEGLAVLFPAWISYVMDQNINRFNRFAKNIFNKDSAIEGVKALKELFIGWKAPSSLSDFNIDKSEIPALAANAMQQGTLGYKYKINYDDVVKILEKSF